MSQDCLPLEDEKGQPETPNPFDPARYRLPQDHIENVGVKKLLTTVPVGRRGNDTWFAIHPDQSYRANVWLLELKTEREKYWVDPSLWGELASESSLRYKAIFTGITRQGVVFLWDIPLPGPDGRDNEWNRSALEAANLATEDWVRVVSNMDLGAYETFIAAAELPDPKWPSKTFDELLPIAFKGKIIDSMDHPVLQSLRGEV